MRWWFDCGATLMHGFHRWLDRDAADSACEFFDLRFAAAVRRVRGSSMHRFVESMYVGVLWCSSASFTTQVPPMNLAS